MTVTLQYIEIKSTFTYLQIYTDPCSKTRILTNSTKLEYVQGI